MKPLNHILVALTAIAASAKKLQIVRVARSPLGNGNDVVDFELFVLGATGTFSTLFLINQGYIGLGESAAIFTLLGISLLGGPALYANAVRDEAKIMPVMTRNSGRVMDQASLTRSNASRMLGLFGLVAKRVLNSTDRTIPGRGVAPRHMTVPAWLAGRVIPFASLLGRFSLGDWSQTINSCAQYLYGNAPFLKRTA